MKTTIKKNLVIALFMFGTLISYANMNFTSIKNSESIKIYGFSALKDEKFTVDLNKGLEIITKPFLVNKSIVIFLTNKKETFSKPVIKSGKNSIYVSKKNTKKEAVKISLYYKDELIYSNTFKEKENLNTLFHLLETEKGTYKVVVYCNNKSFTKEFEI